MERILKKYTEMWALSIQDIGVHSQRMEEQKLVPCASKVSFPPNENKSKGQQCVRTATKESFPLAPVPSEHGQQPMSLLRAHVDSCMYSHSGRGHCMNVLMYLSVAAGPLLRCVSLASLYPASFHLDNERDRTRIAEDSSSHIMYKSQNV